MRTNIPALCVLGGVLVVIAACGQADQQPSSPSTTTTPLPSVRESLALPQDTPPPAHRCVPINESGAAVYFDCGLEGSLPIGMHSRCETPAIGDFPRALGQYFRDYPDKHFGESDPVMQDGHTCGFMVTFKVFVEQP